MNIVHDTECTTVKVDNNEKVGYFIHATLTGILFKWGRQSKSTIQYM